MEFSEGEGSWVRIVLNGVRAVFHRPHPQKETDKGAVRSLRQFLSILPAARGKAEQALFRSIRDADFPGASSAGSAAGISGKSLNAWVVEQLQTAVARVRSIKAAKATGKVKGKPKTVSKVVVKRKSKQAEQHA